MSKYVKHTHIHIIFILILLPLTLSCSSKAKDAEREEGRQLFLNSREIYTCYYDSIKNAKDSVSINQLFTNLDKRLSELNEEYSANADVNIAEGENEILIKLSNKIIKLRNARLSQLSRRGKVIADTTKH